MYRFGIIFGIQLTTIIDKWCLGYRFRLNDSFNWYLRELNLSVTKVF